jgi:hypothetical protein
MEREFEDARTLRKHRDLILNYFRKNHPRPPLRFFSEEVDRGKLSRHLPTGCKFRTIVRNLIHVGSFTLAIRRSLFL